MVIEAQLYPPAKRFVPPAQEPFAFTASTVTFGELLSAPTTRDILLKSSEKVRYLVEMEELRMHLWNLTIDILADDESYPELVAKLDAALRAVPDSERPKL